MRQWILDTCFIDFFAFHCMYGFLVWCQGTKERKRASWIATDAWLKVERPMLILNFICMVYHGFMNFAYVVLKDHSMLIVHVDLLSL